MNEIEQLFETMALCWNRHDLAGYVQLWMEDCDFVNVVGFHRSGRKELLAELEYLHADRFRNTHIDIKRHQIRFLTPEVAVANVWWIMTGDPGQPGFETVDGNRQGVFTHVIQRTADGWRFVASQNTDTLPVPDPLHAPELSLAKAS